MLVRAFEKASVPPWRLVLAGAQGYGAEETLAEIEGSPARDRITVTGWVCDVELQSWYRRSSIFAFPSWDEGFGIPVLEAMACGIPVLTSNVSSLPEVAGGAAVLVPPTDVEAIADGLTQLLDDTALAVKLAARGLEWSANFSWDRCARETLAVYESV